MYDVVVKKFTFAISSPDEFLVLQLVVFCNAVLKVLTQHLSNSADISSISSYHPDLGGGA